MSCISNTCVHYCFACICLGLANFQAFSNQRCCVSSCYLGWTHSTLLLAFWKYKRSIKWIYVCVMLFPERNGLLDRSEIFIMPFCGKEKVYEMRY